MAKRKPPAIEVVRAVAPAIIDAQPEGTQMNAGQNEAATEVTPKTHAVLAALALPEQGSLSLVLPERTTFEQWEAIGRELASREKTLNWWIGDWWAFGENKYGERAALAAEGIFNRAFGTLANCGAVSKAFKQTSLRNEALSWDHHRHIAPLVAQWPGEAKVLLAKAEAEGLTSREVRIEALKRKVHLGIVRPRDVDDDWNYKALKAIAAAWNRAERSVREEFAGLVAESDFGVIEV